MTREIHGDAPDEVARVTQDVTDVAGDAADFFLDAVIYSEQ